MATGGDATPSISGTGQVTLNTTTDISASDHRILFDAAATPAAVTVGASRAPGGAVYLGGLGALTLGDLHTADAPLDVTAAVGLTVAPRAQLDTGEGTISLAAGVNPDGTGSSTGGKLAVAAGATVVSRQRRRRRPSPCAALSTSPSTPDPTRPSSGPIHIVLGGTPTATLTGLAAPDAAMAFDAHGNLFVANEAGGTVSVFAPGSTTPTRTLTRSCLVPCPGLRCRRQPLHCQFQKQDGERVLAPGSTTPTRTLSGLNEPLALAFDAQGNLYPWPTRETTR